MIENGVPLALCHAVWLLLLGERKIMYVCLCFGASMNRQKVNVYSKVVDISSVSVRKWRSRLWLVFCLGKKKDNLRLFWASMGKRRMVERCIIKLLMSFLRCLLGSKNVFICCSASSYWMKLLTTLSLSLSVRS